MRETTLMALVSALLLAGCGGDAKMAEDADPPRRPADDAPERAPKASDLLPPGGQAPELGETGLEEAARAAGCELESFRATSRQHVSDADGKVDYSSTPPTSGEHLATAAEDAAYLTAPDERAVVHSLEHGRVAIWFKVNLPPRARSDLRAFYEDDSSQTLLTPDETGSAYAVAATAWSREPAPNGTGRLLGCKKFTPKVFEALQAFRKRHRGRGPEAIP